MKTQDYDRLLALQTSRRNVLKGAGATAAALGVGGVLGTFSGSAWAQDIEQALQPRTMRADRLLPELLDILPVRLRFDLVDHVCDHADPFGKASTAGRAGAGTFR